MVVFWKFPVTTRYLPTTKNVMLQYQRNLIRYKSASLSILKETISFDLIFIMSTNSLSSRISIKTEFDSFDKALLNSPVLSVTKKRLIRSPEQEQTLTDSNLYGVYGEPEDRVFDSDETIGKTGVLTNPDNVVNSAAKLLQLALRDRKIILENDIDILPASFRLTNNNNEVRFGSAEGTRALVDSILSGEHFTIPAAAEIDHANILSGVYVDRLKHTCKDVCEASESLVGVLQQR